MLGGKGVKRIIKNDSPEWFEEWKENFEKENDRKPHYKGDFSTGSRNSARRRRKLREELLKEQGYICCYCMKRIDLDSSHNEHFWPKDDFEDMDMDYQNLFASCQGDEIFDEDKHCGHRKKDWWEDSMISPTNPDVEKMFRYSASGEVHSVSEREESEIIDQMISEFGLNNYALIRNRKEAIEASELCDKEVSEDEQQDYSDEEIRKFIEFYSDKHEGRYVPYCQAIVDSLERLL